MKKIWKILIALTSLSILLSSCNDALNVDAANNKTNLAYIQIVDQTSRTIQPDFNPDKMTDFVLSGFEGYYSNGVPQNEEIIIAEADSYQELKEKTITLELTDEYRWSFTLKAKKDNSNFIGTTEAWPKVGETLPLSFVLNLDTENNSSTTGEIDIQFSFPLSTNVRGIVAGLYDINNRSTEIENFAAEELTRKITNEITASYSKSRVPEGTYWFRAMFYKDIGCTNCLSRYESIVKVIGGNLSKAEIEIPALEKAHEIHYNLMGGKWVDDYLPKLDFDSNEKVELPDASKLTKNGYIFTGWSLDYSSSASRIKYFENYDSDVTVYAQWQHGMEVTREEAVILDLSTEAGDLYIKATGDFSNVFSTFSAAIIQYTGGNITLDLSEVTGITKIPDEAFKGCTKLTKVIIPECVIDIGKNAFAGCYSLTEIELPVSVTTIESGAFTSSNITVINYTGSLNEWLTRSWKSNYRFGAAEVYGYGYDLYLNGEKFTEYKIPDETVEVDYPSAFYGCTSLKKITIPASVTKIGERTFFGCTALSRVDYEGTFEQWCQMVRSKAGLDIPYKLYIDGKNLSGDIVIPEGITKIQAFTFNGCEGLSSITIPSCVTSIDNYAFFNYYDEIKTLTIPGTVTDMGSEAIYGCLMEELTVPSLDANNTGYYTVLQIPEKVKKLTVKRGSINSTSLRNHTKLKNLVLENGVTSIVSNAFYGCESLESITISSTVTNIGDKAFDDCKKLKELIIEDSSESLSLGISSRYGFFGNGMLERVYLGRNISYSISSFEGNHSPFFGPSNTFETVEISNYVTSIGKLFNECMNLKQIILPESITSIDDNAFESCESLQSITIPESVTSIGYQAFLYCSDQLSLVFENPDDYNWYYIPNNSTNEEGLVFEDGFDSDIIKSKLETGSIRKERKE